MGIYKRLIISFGSVLVILVVVDLVISYQTNQKSQVEQTFKIIQNATSNIGQEAKPTVTPTPTEVPFAGMPKSYKNISIPVDIYDQAQLRYRKDKADEVTAYVIDIIHKYYIYKDFLDQNKIPYNAQFPVTLSNIEIDVPKMEELIQQNLISYVDFAFIKARFRYALEEERLQGIYGDLKVKAHTLIEQYQQQLSVENVDASSVVAASNKDLDLMSMNNNEANKIQNHYTPDQDLFFTDKKFNPFLFAQKQGKVSSIYTLRGKTGDEYAYLIVYPIFVQKKTYTNINDMISGNLKYFTDY